MGTKPETEDTDKANLHATAPAPDPTGFGDSPRKQGLRPFHVHSLETNSRVMSIRYHFWDEN
jgi:hypothetical protein